ncbi:MAG: NlpC/P60 family protein [Streptomycetales bacterium]
MRDRSDLGGHRAPPGAEADQHQQARRHHRSRGRPGRRAYVAGTRVSDGGRRQLRDAGRRHGNQAHGEPDQLHGACRGHAERDRYRLDVSWRALYRVNDGIIDDPTLIFPGQRLKIPRDGSSGDTAAQGAVAHSGTFGQRVLALAERLEGTPYLWGGETPATGFDCSGFTQYVYGQVGKQIPRTSGGQYVAARQISRAEARPGDLVFFHSVRGVYHVAIYAGENMVWQSPNPGRSVELAQIWTDAISFGRF